MPSPAQDLQIKIQKKIDEEHAHPPEPIEVTEESDDPHYLATCAVLNGTAHSAARRRDDGELPSSINGRAKSQMSNSLDTNLNSNHTQQSLLEGTQKSVASRTPEDRLRDKIAGEKSALGESQNDSVDSPGLPQQSGDDRKGNEEHNHQQQQQEQQQNRHHRPSQVQEIMDFAGSAARSSPVRIGARRTPAGVGVSSKTDTSARDERVGAFFVQSTSHSPNNADDDNNDDDDDDDDDGPTLDSLGLTEEEQRWISLESGHPLSSSGIGTGLQALTEEEHSPPQQREDDNKNKREGRDLVCGMKKHAFVGIIVAFAVLTVAIVGTAIGVSTSSKPSASPTPSPPTDVPRPQSNQTNPPVPSPTEPDPVCENDIVELPRQILDEPDDEFGSSIAISRNNAVVGATGCDSCRGAAYVYERSGDEDWVQMAQLFPLESYRGDSFGKSIDIDGDIIAVGGNCMVEVGNQKFPAGCVHIFVRTDGNRWTQETTLVGDDGANIPEVSFASSLAIDDGVLVVGEPSGDFQEQGQRSGFIYIYERQNDAKWIEIAKIRPSDAQDRDDFGYSLDMDEEYLVVGAPRRHSGAAYVFGKQLDGTWLERMKLVPADASEGDSFARSVSITQYGTIAVGAIGDDDNGYSSGSVYVFDEIDGTGRWEESAKIKPDDGLTSDRFGASVAIFRETIVVGAIGDDELGENSGAVYYFSFDLSTSSWQQTSKIVSPDGGEKAEFGSDIDVYGTTAVVASFHNAPGLLVGGLVDTGKVYAVDLLC